MRNSSLGDVPSGRYPDFLSHLRRDAVSGFLVFLIALPLCMGISVASGCPAVSGLLTAMIGGMVTPFVSNSELTIKGPAAGMIAIVLGAVTAMTPETVTNPAAAAFEGYQKMLGLAVVAGGLQILLGACKLGRLGEFFPVPAVQGMLVAIGLIIVSKQLHVLLLGTPVRGGFLALVEALPSTLKQMDNASAAVGIGGLLILVVHSRVSIVWVRKIPAPLWVVGLAVVVALMMDVPQTGLVHLPTRLADGFSAPDFSGLGTWEGWKWVVMLAVVGSLESVLSANAVDLLDPWKRRTDLNRDLLAVGVANTIGACVGAIPMISEIVRSSANRNHGARTRWSNFMHGLFLMVMVVVAASLLNRIPLSALAALLVFTGIQLAAPVKFLAMFRTGRAEFAVFLATVSVTLATDLLLGVAAGVVVQWVVSMRWVSGNPFRVRYRRHEEDGAVLLSLTGPLIFSNWLSLRARLSRETVGVVLDVSEVSLIDHSVMRKLEETRVVWEADGRQLRTVGLEALRACSKDSLATRVRADALRSAQSVRVDG
jgi:MFS superfamily sulfate permease-like transporter